MARPESLASRLTDAVKPVFWVLLGIFLLAPAWPVPESVRVLAFLTAFFVYRGTNPADGDYSRSTVGVDRRVETEPAQEDDRCSVCDDPTEDGERRTYAKQAVLLGVPLYTLDWGENVYCVVCSGQETDGTGESDETVADAEFDRDDIEIPERN